MQHAALGALGGAAGAPSRIAWNGRESGFPLKGRSRMQGGDRLVVRYPGGGGFGDPRERDRAAVQVDLEAGRISARSAAEEYGL